MSEQKRENGLLARGQSLIRDIMLTVFGNEALFLIVTFLYATLGDSAIVAWYREPMSLLYGYIVIPWGAALCLLRLQRRASSLEPARADVVTLFVLYLWILVPFAIRFGFTGKNVTAWHGYAVMFFGIYASISERKQREREMLMATMSVLSAVFAYVFCGALLFCAWSGTIYAADLGPFGFGAVEGWLCSGVHYNITGMIVISLCMMCVMGVGYYRNILLKLFCLIPAVMSMAVIVLTQSRTSRYALLAVLAAAAFDGVRRVLCRRNVAAGLLAAVLGAALWVQIVLFFVVSIAALAATRPLVQRMLRRDETPTNADRVLGQTARVTETIDNTVPTGAVYADGKTWTARSASGRVIPKDTMVKVQRMEGVRLFVEEEAGQPVHS